MQRKQVTPTSVFPESIAWSRPPAKFSLSPNEVHVWCASLVPAPEVLECLEALLAPHEKIRARQFAFATDQDKFIAGRGILRELLGAYVSQPAGELVFDSGAHGKPVLRTKASYPRIQFNLSHAQNVALYAFACRRELGIDLELIHADFAGQEVAERFFSAEELSELRALPVEVRAHRFFTYWTCKEAYLKARGYGLKVPLSSFDISPFPGWPKELQSADNRKWRLCPFEPAPGFVAAVVGEGDDWYMRHFEWEPALLGSVRRGVAAHIPYEVGVG